MLPTRRLPALLLLTILAGCATQVEGGDDGLGNDVPTKPDDSGVPTFDIVTPEMDAGEPEDVPPVIDPDTGPVTKPDVGSPPEDQGSVSRPDVQTVRDVGTPTTDRGGTSGSCTSATTCASCTALATCGWCALTARCLDGTATGPTGSVCAMGWAWLSSACTSVDPCNSSTTCSACAARAECGWCGATNRCVTANTAGTAPATGSCSLNWASEPSACTTAPFDPCSVNTDCYSCAQASACGWCRATRRCMTGVSSGPNPTYGACTDWIYTPGQCTPALTDPCRTSTSCTSCIGRSQCGFCRDTNTCHTGTSSGPTDRACRSGRWYWDTLLGICFS